MSHHQWGGSGPNYGVDYSAHGRYQAPRGPDPMLSRVQQSLSNALWHPEDAQGEDDYSVRSVRDIKQQFSGPGTAYGHQGE